MGTRGVIGFVRNEREAIAYNHFDSYPSQLGKRVVEFLTLKLAKPNGLQELEQEVDALGIVDDQTSPATREQILALREVSNFYVSQFTATGPQRKDVSKTSPDGLPDENVEWYNLLRDTQGDPEMILAYGYIEDSRAFPLDGLFCEWGYIIDLDKRVLEVYKGYRQGVPKQGRWAGRPTAEDNQASYDGHVEWCKKNGRDPWLVLETPKYGAIELIATYSFSDLPSADELVAECDPELEDE